MNANRVRLNGLFAGFFAACCSLTPLHAATFSDDNWISMGGFPGASGLAYAAVVDGPGNLHICGEFAVEGGVVANYIAKWNGSSWSA